MSRPFRVSKRWLEYAHEPGAQDGQPLACEIMKLVEEPRHDHVLIDRIDLVAEVVDVAELFTPERGQGRDERVRSLQASRVVARGWKWLFARGYTVSH